VKTNSIVLKSVVRWVLYFGLGTTSYLKTVSCSSTSDANEEKAAEDTETKKEDKKDAKEGAGEQNENKVFGEQVFIITTLSNELALEGSVGINTLNGAISSIEELVKKDDTNVNLLVTYMTLLRLNKENPDTYRNIQRRAGGIGAKNPWFLIESAYNALTRKEFSMAEYLLDKALRISQGNQEVKSAVSHAFGIRYWEAGRRQQAIFEMRKSATANPPYLPSALTLGFLALKAGDAEGATSYFRSVLNVLPMSVNARLGLATALRARGKHEEAMPLIQALYKQKSNDRRILWNYALLLSDKPEHRKEAIEVLNKYFQTPGTIENIDSRANDLLTKLNSMPVGAAGSSGK
jgi:tetratricopeptide (TPR) repeat protein